MQLQTVCVRHEPPSVAGDALDRHTGAAYVTPAILDGRWMVRISIGALEMERPNVEDLLALLQQATGASTV